jgi:hypothetical protein
LLVLAAAGAAPHCRAQDMEPRSYSPNPTGVQFIGLAYGRSTGGVVLDPSLPITDANAHLNTGLLGYGRTFSLFERSAIATIGMPYLWGNVSGSVGEDRREITRSGLGDARLRLAVNLIGGPALRPSEFARRRPQPTLGASLTISAPVGQYDPQKLINIGAHRWGFKPELGFSFPLERWYLELYGGAWFFTENDEFFGGSRRKQEPIASIQSHIVYMMRPSFWAAFDATAFRGGRTTVNGTRNADLQSNTRVGLTLSFPAGKGHSVKLVWTHGLTTRVGADFQTIGVAWQFVSVD